MRRFSNSPFTPAPACSRPRSSDISFTLRSASGTSPAAIRSARPSATAVLPTPGSPVRIGLFCRRRVRMSITCRISPSRPRIGSILPARAWAVRSVQNWSSGPLPRGVSPGAAPAASPGSGAPASSASVLPSASASSPPRRSASAGSASRLGALSFTVRARPSSASSAASMWPERTLPVPPSSEASSQASFSQVMMSGESAGARALPVRSLSSARVISFVTRPLSIPCLRSSTFTSEPWVSTSFSSRCSISTL